MGDIANMDSANNSGMMTTSSIPKLEANNYQSWIEMLKISLELQGLDKTLEDEERSTDKEKKQAQLQILRSMDEDHRKRVRGCTSPKDILRRLEMIYNDKSAANAHRLLVQYYRYSKRPEDSMSAHIGKMSEMRMQLADIGEKQTERVFHCTLIGSLPAEYTSILEIWESTPVTMQTTENLVARLLRKEADIKKEDGEKALVAPRPERRGAQRPWLSPEEIAEKKKNSTCGKCGQRGHWWKECPKSKQTAMIMQKQEEYSEVNFNILETGEHLRDEWVSDSGASAHMCNRREWFTEYKELNEPKYCLVGDGQQLKIEGSGTIKIVAMVAGRMRPATLTNVLFIPKLATNLLSIGAAAEKGITTTFKRELCVMEKNGQVVAEGSRLLDKLYLMRIRPGSQAYAMMTRETKTVDDYHRILGHAGMDSVKKLLSRLNIKTGSEPEGKCKDCPQGKGTHATHPTVGVRAEKPGNIHVDLSGKINKESLLGYRYYLLCKDEYTDFLMVYFCRDKGVVPALLARLIIDFEALSGTLVRTIHSDNGSEFVNETTNLLFLKEKIVHVKSAPYCPQQNGRIEREMRTVTEAARTMLTASQLPTELWSEAIATAVFVRNRLPNSKNILTPLERLTNRVPYIGHMVEFGTEAEVIVNDKYLTKWDSRTVRGYVVGYTQRRNTYKVFLPEKKKVIETCDLVLTNRKTQPIAKIQAEHESRISATTKQEQMVELPVPIPRPGTSQKKDTQQEVVEETLEWDDESPTYDRTTEQVSFDKEPRGRGNGKPYCTGDRLEQFFEDFRQMNCQSEGEHYYSNVPDPRYRVFPARPTYPPPSPPVETEAVEATAPPITPQVGSNTPPSGSEYMNQSYATAEEEQPGRNSATTTALLGQSNVTDELPKTIDEAINGENAVEWKAAINCELEAHKDNGTWKIVERPLNTKPLSTKWVFTIKRDAAGNLEKYKARLVARGFEQRAGVDFFQTFAPVARLDTIRVLLAISATRQYARTQFDISTAFLNGQLKEAVYIEPPKGLELSAGSCLKLSKALYGLKQAPRAWSSTFELAMIDCGFKPTTSDPCCFIHKNQELYLVVYVDDCLIIGKEQRECLEIVRLLEKRFKLKLLRGDLFLGIEIIDNKGIELTQRRYIHEVVSRFKMEDAKGVTSPIVDTKAFDNCASEEETNAPYREAIGCLMYLACCTRPDVMFAVNYLSRFSQSPKASHWTAVKRIIRYLKQTADYKIAYSAESRTVKIDAYTDADWASDPNNRQSTSGVMININGGPVIFGSRKQPNVSLSSTEAEFVAACEGAKEIKWLTQLFHELEINTEKPELHIDNQSTIKQIQNNDTKRRSKHVDIKYHYVRREYQEGLFDLSYIESKEQLADALTKPVPGEQLRRLMGRTKMQNSKLPLKQPGTAGIALLISCLLAVIVATAGQQVMPLETTREVLWQRTNFKVSKGIKVYNITGSFPSPCEVWPTTDSMYDIQRLAHDSLEKLCKSYYARVIEDVTTLGSCLPGHNKLIKLIRKKRVAIAPIVAGAAAVIAITESARWIYNKYIPWSTENRIIHLLEEDERINKALYAIEKDLSLFKDIGQDRLQIERRLTQKTEDNRQAIIHLAQISPEIAWIAAQQRLTLDRFQSALKQLTKTCRQRKVDLDALHQLFGIEGIAQENEDTYLNDVRLTTKNTATMSAYVDDVTMETEVFEVMAIRHWANLTTEPTFVEYAGPKFVIHNAGINCTRGIEKPSQRITYETCKVQDYKDGRLDTWTPVTATDAEIKNMSKPLIYATDTHTIVYCLYHDIIIEGKRVACPTRPVKLPKTMAFEFEHATYNVNFDLVNSVHKLQDLETIQVVNATDEAFKRDIELLMAIKHKQDSTVPAGLLGFSKGTLTIPAEIGIGLSSGLLATLAAIITIYSCIARACTGASQGGVEERHNEKHEEYHEDRHSEQITVINQLPPAPCLQAVTAPPSGPSTARPNYSPVPTDEQLREWLGRVQYKRLERGPPLPPKATSGNKLPVV